MYLKVIRFLYFLPVFICLCIVTFAEYVCHVFVRSDSLGGVLVSDLEYPQRVVFTLLNKVSIKIT